MQPSRHSLPRRFHPLLAAAAVALCPGTLVAQSDELPPFVGNLEPSNRTVIAEIVPGSELDYVVLADGWYQGFQTGMRCEIRRDGAVLGELILARVRTDFSIALILVLGEGTEIGRGDLVTMKTFGAQLPQS